MKRMLPLLLALFLLLQTGACAAPGARAGQAPEEAEARAERLKQLAADQFEDISAQDWYAEAIGFCLEQNLMSGAAQNRFEPNQTASRAMTAAVLRRQAGNPPPQSASAFTDIPDDAWYLSDAAWAAETGLFAGYGDGRFGGEDPVTRQQFVAVLWRKAGQPVAQAGGSFADQSDIASYAAEAAVWAREQGVVQGRQDGRFDPKSNISRGEAAAMLYRWLYTPEEQGASQEPKDNSQPPASGSSGGGSSIGGGSSEAPPPSPNEPEKPAEKSKTLVVYFSATGTTKPLAQYAQEILEADLYEIQAKEPYTSEDLNYSNRNSRTTREQNDPSARPALASSIPDLANYDVVLLGYPIWHGQAPRIISTFLESGDFSGKTVVPFCTSHSSGIGQSDANLHSLAPQANWLPGRRFAGGTGKRDIERWLQGLKLPEPQPEQLSQTVSAPVFDLESKTVRLNNGYTMPINGLGTYSLQGETCVASVKSALREGVRLIDTARAYGNEEAVGQAIRESMEELGISREEIFVITKIYPGADMKKPEQAIQGCLDRLNVGYVDMMLLHHPDPNDVTAYQAMEQFVREGKIRSLGLSNWYEKELKEFLPQISIMPALVQNEIHPYYQENDVIPYIQSLGVVVQGWYPLGGRRHTQALLSDPTISAIAQAHGVSSAQVILRWNLQKGVVVIPGSSNPEHIRENTQLYHFQLTQEEMNQINALDRNEKHDWY